jgi:hypothetical protein
MRSGESAGFLKTRNSMKLVSAPMVIVLSLFLASASAFAQTGGISGTVTTTTAENITSGYVDLTAVSDPNTLVKQTFIANGAYSFSGIADGSYNLLIVNPRTSTANYVGQLYNNIPCQFGVCDRTGALAVTIAGGAVVSGINFVLSKGGAISGTITDGVNTLPGITTVSLFTDEGSLAAYLQISGKSDFLFDALIPASYRVYASNDSGYLSELYTNTPCPGQSCDIPSGTPIAVADGQTTSNINLVLPVAGTISGLITDSATGAPVADAGLILFDSHNANVGAANSGADGTYKFGEGFPNGKYYMEVIAQGYTSQVYKNIACGEICTISAGTPIVVAAGSNATANMALSAVGSANLPDLSGKISGIPATKTVKLPTFTLKNTGKLDAGQFVVYFFRSATKKYSQQKARLFKFKEFASLAAGAQKKITFANTKDPKHPYLIVIVDPGSEVPETNETNNMVVKKIG